MDRSPRYVDRAVLPSAESRAHDGRPLPLRSREPRHALRCCGCGRVHRHRRGPEAAASERENEPIAAGFHVPIRPAFRPRNFFAWRRSRRRQGVVHLRGRLSSFILPLARRRLARTAATCGTFWAPARGAARRPRPPLCATSTTSSRASASFGEGASRRPRARAASGAASAAQRS